MLEQWPTFTNFHREGSVLSMTLGFAVLAVLSGCSDVVVLLPEVRVEGGSEEQRAAVVEEIEAFEDWTGGGRVALSRIEFRTLPDGLIGAYSDEQQVVLLSDDRTTSEIRNDLRHELCHAIDRQNDLASDLVGVLDEWVEAMSAKGLWIDNAHVVRDSHDDFRREAFARGCERGPFAAELTVSSPCEESMGELMAAIGDAVWTDADGFAEWTERGPGPLIAGDARLPWNASIRILETTAEEVFGLQYDNEQLWFYASNGALAKGGPFTAIDVPNVHGVVPQGVTVITGRTFDDRALVAGVVYGPDLSATRPFWLHHRDGGWSAFSDCLPVGEEFVFEASGRFLAGSQSGDTVFWRDFSAL